MRFQAVIFDCDGVLVDSETLEKQVFVECVADLGLNLTLAEAMDAYKGRKLAEWVADVKRRLGRCVPDTFIPISAHAVPKSFKPNCNRSLVLKSSFRPCSPCPSRFVLPPAAPARRLS